MKIYSLWDSGRDVAPDVVKRCFDRWEQLNPELELCVLNYDQMLEELSFLPFDPSELAIQTASDILRMHILASRGGVWTDATVLPMLPVKDWLNRYVEECGVFMFSGNAIDRPLSNYLIAGLQGNPLIEAIDAAGKRYWSRPRRLVPSLGRVASIKSAWNQPEVVEYVRYQLARREDPYQTVRPDADSYAYHPYFWQHYLMRFLVDSVPDLARIVERMTYRVCAYCHTVQHVRRDRGLNFDRALPFLLRMSPVQKLDWRQEWPDAVFDIPDPASVLF